jgi:uncharacterized membrane protein YtjA (UPF0391 family)
MPRGLRGLPIGPAVATHSVVNNLSLEALMFTWAIIFFIIAIIAAIFGFGGVAASAAGAAKIVFVVALVLAVIGFFAGRRGPL